jgi:site-specific recombinase XerD
MNQILEGFKEFMISKRNSKSSVENSLTHVRAFLTSMNVTDPKNVTAQMITDYFTGQSKNSQSKINQMIWSLRIFFKWAGVSGLVLPKQKRPIKKIKRTITEHELVNILVPRIEYLFRDPLPVQALLYFMFYSGLEVKEILLIKYTDFTLGLNELILPYPHGKIRKIPLAQPLVEVMKRFFRYYSQENNCFNTSTAKIKRIFKVLHKDEALGPDRVIEAKLFRYSFLNHCFEKGIDLYTLLDLMNIEDIKTLAGNIKLMSDEAKADFLKRINN